MRRLQSLLTSDESPRLRQSELRLWRRLADGQAHDHVLPAPRTWTALCRSRESGLQRTDIHSERAPSSGKVDNKVWSPCPIQAVWAHRLSRCPWIYPLPFPFLLFSFVIFFFLSITKTPYPQRGWMAKKPSSASSLKISGHVESLSSWVRASEVVRVWSPKLQELICNTYVAWSLMDTRQEHGQANK